MNISKSNFVFILVITVLATYIVTREIGLKQNSLTSSTNSDTHTTPKAKTPTGKDGQEADPYEKEQVKNTIVKNSKLIQECYLEWLKSNPKADSITVKLDWTIAANGSVESPQVVDSTAEKAMNDCLTDKMKTIEFPQPPEGRPFYVAHKFSFKTEALLDKEKKEREEMEKKFLPKSK